LVLYMSLKDASDRDPSDTAIVEGLLAEIKTGEGKKLVLQQDLAKLAADRSAAEAELAQLKRNPDLIERDRLSALRAADESLGQSNSAEIARLVDWYDSPPSSFFFSIRRDGSIAVSIDHWVLEKGAEALNFTSTPPAGQKPTIINTQYTELGGVYQFDVLVYLDPEQTQIMDTYSFRVARLKYDAADGRVYLSGKITRTRLNMDGTTEVRDGFAKLIDRNN